VFIACNFTLESFIELFVQKLNNSGSCQLYEPLLSGSLEPVPTPSRIAYNFKSTNSSYHEHVRRLQSTKCCAHVGI